MGGKRKRKSSHRSSYNKYVDNLLAKNIQKLKTLGKYPYQRTDGEQAIATALKKMHIRYIPEFFLGKLKGDNYNYRIADFYLPREKLVIEHLGKWDVSEQERRRYNYKTYLYAKNNIKCVSIYPKNLNNLSWILKQKIRTALYGRMDKGKEPPAKTPDTELELADKVPIFIKSLFKMGAFGLLVFTIVAVVVGLMGHTKALTYILIAGGILFGLIIAIIIIVFILYYIIYGAYLTIRDFFSEQKAEMKKVFEK